MAKLVYSYHNKKMAVTSFKSLWQHMYSKRHFFLVDVEGDLGMIEYYTRFVIFIDRPMSENNFIKNSDFSFAKVLIDDHNRYIRGLMQTANQQIKVECDTPTHEREYLSMHDALERAFIMYKGQQFF
ncbi:MAG: hypothetical protein IJ679_06245 [Lachnospiraceae bacterium]|nr:hypothetical protein [Lachnospiraceae bacterium]